MSLLVRVVVIVVALVDDDVDENGPRAREFSSFFQSGSLYRPLFGSAERTIGRTIIDGSDNN